MNKNVLSRDYLKSLFSMPTRYKIVAFISGFALMSYELAGSRILTPVVGSSTYVWTGIIGVIIMALSAGYFIGGQLADRREKTGDIALLLVGAAGGVVFTLLLSDAVLETLGGMTIDIRLKSLLASLMLFAPASVLLGAISPYLAKMHTSSLHQTGRSIATLSALNSLGGITGTFLTGFVFFGFIGTRETLFLLLGLLLFCSLLLWTKDVGRVHARALIAIAVTGFLLASLQPAGSVVATIETPSSSYQVRDVTFNYRPARVLTMGPGGYQSGVYTDGSKELVFNYTRAIAYGVALHDKPRDILVLGGGTFTLPEYFAQQYPQAKIDAVEIDPKLEGIAKQYFNYSSPKNVTIHAEDARTFVNANQRDYDIIVIDAYSDMGTPFSMATTEFAAKLADSLKPQGVILSNVIGANNDQCRQLLGSVYSAYTQYLKGSIYAVDDRSLTNSQNIIAAFSKDNDQFLQQFSNAKVDTSEALRLTDNFAPIERFHQNCLNSRL